MKKNYAQDTKEVSTTYSINGAGILVLKNAVAQYPILGYGDKVILLGNREAL